MDGILIVKFETDLNTSLLIDCRLNKGLLHHRVGKQAGKAEVAKATQFLPPLTQEVSPLGAGSRGEPDCLFLLLWGGRRAPSFVFFSGI